MTELHHLSDDEIVEQIKRRGLYDKVVKELFGPNPLLSEKLFLQTSTKSSY